MSTSAEPVASASSTSPASTARNVLTWSLRLFGGVDLLAFAAFLMPTAWLRVGHELCGLGPFPEGPIPEYLARSASLLWAMHGGVLLFLSLDVLRQVAVIRFIAGLTVLAGIGLVGLGLWTGLPWWWVILEGPVFAATGVWYLWWLRHLPGFRSG